MKKAVRRNFDASVSAYGEYERRTGRFTALSELLAVEMAAAADHEFETVLDAGSGSGASTSVLQAYADAPVALDVSEEMLRENGATDRVQGDFDALPFGAGTFDAVAYTASLFLVPDPTVTVVEARRVLRPGGVIGAVAPLGWFSAEGADVFESLPRESRSPATTADVLAAVDAEFETEGGTWRFATMADHVRQFHEIPAMAARLYPTLDPAERVRETRNLLEGLEGTLEQRWQWVVGTTN